MRIPADIRASVYIGIGLGFSRRLLGKVLRPARKAIIGGRVMEYELTLCLDYRGKGLRCYVAGPWKVGWRTLVKICNIASEWTKEMPEGFGMSLPGDDGSDRMGMGELFRRAKVGLDVEREVQDVVSGCLAEIGEILE